LKRFFIEFHFGLGRDKRIGVQFSRHTFRLPCQLREKRYFSVTRAKPPLFALS
jgi:hypothetical protein